MMKKGSPKAIYLRDYQAPEYFIRAAKLRFELFADKTLVYAELQIEANKHTQNTTLELHGEQLKLLGLQLDDKELSAEQYSRSEQGLSIYNVPKTFVLSSTVEIDPASNTALEGLYLSSGNYCTQCEAEGFRKITYYIDRPDVMAVFSVRIEADKKDYPVLLSNGNRIATGLIDDDRHFAQWHDPFPKPSYLFALVAGNLACRQDQYTTLSGRQVELEVYTESHNADKCEHALASLKKAMQWDEQVFDLEYDLDTYMIVAVDDFNMGAMENKGLNVFNSKYVLASPETATDADYMGIEGVIAHEYFHNWTGNRVTCRDWFQLSLKEGLTVFRDQEFTSDVTSRSVKRIQDVRYLRTYQFAEDAGPMAHPIRPASYVEINNFYTLTVYEKGAEVVRMYQTLLGREGFKKGLQCYFAKHDGQAVTTDDFAAAMAEANGFDLGNFSYWYSQSGTPTLSVSGEWKSASKEYVLSVEQIIPSNESQPTPAPYLVPLKVSLFGSRGNPLVLQLRGYTEKHKQSCTLHVSEIKQQFVFVEIDEQPVPSLLQDFSAPVKLNYHYTPADYAFLMSNDVDPFNRWDAGQRFATDWLLSAVEAIQKDKILPSGEDFIEAMAATLRNEHLDAAFLAEMMILPQESYLAEFVSPVDVDAIYKARKQLQIQLATVLEELLLETFQKNLVADVYQYNAVDMGKRRLTAVCLSYLNGLQKEQYFALSKTQYEQANNMTDTMAVLEAINDYDIPLRTQALAEFGKQWQHDALVMDKWFSLQARSRQAGVLGTVKQLLGHPGFSIKNPNKVRALIGVFAMANPTAFHAKDGSGYTFLTEQIIQLNAINPQVAARLVRPLIDWKKFDGNRQQLMKDSLTEIKSVSNLSRDVFELVDRSLNGVSN